MNNILKYLESSYSTYPDREAVLDDQKKYTYGEYYHLTRRIGSGLCAYVGQRQPVGVYMEKCADAVAVFMGAVWAGGFYSCLNTELPGSRLEQIVSVLSPSLIVTQQALLENQQALNDAQIRMLQAQLNPHFLCNTLDTMKWISKIN